MRDSKKFKQGRRSFLKTTSLGAGGMSLLLPTWARPSEVHDGNPATELKVAGYPYPRVEAIMKNKLEFEGHSHSFSKGKISELNTQAFSGEQAYDISELGLLPYILAYANEDFRDYCLVPVFPFRVFRHKSIFIHADSGIKEPKDLIGRKVVTPGYSSTSLTWIRGMLQDQYNVKPTDVEWVIARADSSKKFGGTASSQEQVLPDGLQFSFGEPGKDESDLLLAREADAVFHAVEPRAFMMGNPEIKRLFPDSKKTEQEYFTQTGIFPIMHSVGVKRELLDSNDGLAKIIFGTYSKAKSMNYDFMRKLGWAFDSLPWYGQEYEETRNLMGENYYSYGFRSNLKALDKLCGYAYEQGLAKKRISATDLFHPSSLELEE